MTHPLLDAGLELDCAVRDLAHGPDSTRRRQRVLDAAANVRVELRVIAGDAEARPITIDDVERVLRQARKSGVGWSDIAAVVHHLQGG